MTATHTHDLSAFNGNRLTIVEANEDCRLCPCIARFMAGERSLVLDALTASAIGMMLMVHNGRSELRARERRAQYDFLPNLQERDRKGRLVFLQSDGTRRAHNVDPDSEGAQLGKIEARIPG